MSAGGSGWSGEAEAILRGLAHALSNRTLALRMAAEAVDDPEEEVRSESRKQIDLELEQLVELGRLMKLLARDAARPEALQPGEVLADAVALHRFHLGLRDVPLEVTAAESVLPVRVERWRLLRALVLLVGEARRSARDRGSAVELRLDGDAERVWIEAAAEGSGPEAAAELEALAGEAGGGLERGDGRLRLVLPSLLALREREREARARAAPEG